MPDGDIRPHAPIHSPSHYQVIFLALFVSISPNFCVGQIVFSPQSKGELKSAINTCLKLSRDLNCLGSAHGLIADWDVSKVADMSDIFIGATSFHGEVSKWDV